VRLLLGQSAGDVIYVQCHAGDWLDYDLAEIGRAG